MRAPAASQTVIHGALRPSAPVAARRAGEQFLSGYVAYLYGHRSIGRLRGLTASLRRELRHTRVRVPPARAQRTPHILRIHTTAQSLAAVVVMAIVDDGDLADYAVSAVAELSDRRWRVTRVLDA
jgi:hypothetical protein